MLGFLILLNILFSFLVGFFDALGTSQNLLALMGSFLQVGIFSYFRRRVVLAAELVPVPLQL